LVLDQPTYVAADLRLRRLAVLTMLAATVIATAMIGWFVPWLARAIVQARVSGTLSVPLASYLFLAVVALLAAPVVGFGVYAVRFGRVVLSTRQYPPPGARVLRRTKILRGRPASVLGSGQVVLGALLVACGLALVGVAFWGAWLIGFAGPSRLTMFRLNAPDVATRTMRVAAATPAEPFARRAVIFVEASAAEIDSARASSSESDFAVIADDLMFYRASAHERIDSLGSAALTVTGRRPLEFVVQGAPRAYDFAEVPTLDLIVVYHPGREPRAFAPLDVEQALEYFRDGSPDVR
jgi:hypothetical protein